MRITKHEVPRRSVDGMVSVYCQTCQREICRRTNSQFRSVVKCLLCQLKEAGVEDPESKVLPQYYMFDPTKPPVPLNAESDDVILNLFPEEKQEFMRMPSSGGVAGTVKSIFRAVGFGKPKVEQSTSQKTAAKRRKESSLFK